MLALFLCFDKYYGSLQAIRPLDTIIIINDPLVDSLIEKGNVPFRLGMVFSEIKKLQDKVTDFYDKAIKSYDYAIKLDLKSQKPRAYCKSVVLKSAQS